MAFLVIQITDRVQEVNFWTPFSRSDNTSQDSSLNSCFCSLYWLMSSSSSFSVCFIFKQVLWLLLPILLILTEIYIHKSNYLKHWFYSQDFSINSHQSLDSIHVVLLRNLPTQIRGGEVHVKIFSRNQPLTPG